MRKIGTFFYHIGQGFIGISRNIVMSSASVLVLVSCMLIVGTFYLVIDNFSVNLKSTDNINMIKITIPDELTDDQVTRVFSDVLELKEKLDNVEKVEFFTKMQNLQIYREKNPKLSDYLVIFNEDDNPLPASIEITFTSFTDPDFEMDEVYQLKNKLEEIENIHNEDIHENIALYDKVTSVTDTLTMVALYMLVILLLVSLFVIMNTIKLGMHSRRHEIMFMRYVGATKSFIRTPFIIEGIIIGLISAAVAYGLQFYVYNYIIADILTENSTINSASIIELAPFENYRTLLIYGFLGIGFFAGVVSSSLSIKKYLKV
ncbi:MAG: permease-like cell division protein FtsX [Eubacteriales bacterium]|nr:permease-like cell division protein FtsX [Eubacteriales bacterium]MDD4421641.1 permease-like cell division protein FtsX [Eubacteriales bacterium]